MDGCGWDWREKELGGEGMEGVEGLGVRDLVVVELGV